jgi:tape measure domain-containing protein
MSDFNVKILEVKYLLTDVNTLLDTQKKSLDNVSASLSKYGGKVPSEFLNAQKKSIELGKEQTDIQKKIEQSAKNQTTVMQKLTKEELSYVNAVERGIKSKERDILANKKLSDAYGQLTTKRNESARALQNLIASEKASNAEIRKAQKEFDVLNKKVATADKAIGKLSQANNGIGKLTSGVSNLMGAFGIATGLGLAAGIVTNIYETTKALQSLDLALKMVSGTQEEYASNTAFVAKIAEKWGLEIKDTTQQFTQFYTAAKGLMSESQIKETFEGVAKAGSLMGLSVDKQQAAFYALEQMMSKGTVTAEELKKQLGNAMPGAMKAAGMAYMELHPKIKTIQEAEKMLMKEMKAGALDSATYVPLIVKNLNKLYGTDMINKVETLAANQNRLSNSWTDLVRSMNESETGGISKFFSAVLSSATTLMKELVRLNTSWDELYAKAKGKGRQDGISMAEYQFEQGGKSESGANASITVATKNYTKANKELLQVQKEGQIAVDYVEKNKYRLGIGQYTASDVKKLRERKEVLLEEMNLWAAVINKTKELKKTIGKEPETKDKIIGETADQKKAREKVEKQAQKERDEISKNAYNRKVSDLEREKELIKDKYDFEEQDNKKKVKLSVDLSTKEIEIIEAQFEEEIKLVKKHSDLWQIAENKRLTARENSISESAKRITDIYRKEFQAQLDLNGGIILSPSDTAEKNKQDKQSKEPKPLTDDERNYLKEKAKESTRVFNEFVGEFAKEVGFSDTFDFLTKEIVDKDGNITTMFETMIDKGATAEEKMKANFLAISTVAQDVFNKISEASNARYEKEFSNLEKQKEEAIKNAGDSDSAKKKIEQDYEKRRKEIEKRQFKSKQKMSIANIAIDTAQAIMSIASTGGGTGYSDYGITAGILIGITTALGAAQIAMVASQKPPSYFTGTDNAKEGLAWTQEKGAEIHTDRHGNIKTLGDNKGARLTKMSAGDIVYNAEETKRLMFQNDYNSLLTSNGILEPKVVVNSGITYAEMDEIVGRHIGNQPKHINNFDKAGFESYISKSGNITKNNSNRGQGIGQIV